VKAAWLGVFGAYVVAGAVGCRSSIRSGYEVKFVPSSAVRCSDAGVSWQSQDAKLTAAENVKLSVVAPALAFFADRSCTAR
jgi:hypothetical protein